MTSVFSRVGWAHAVVWLALALAALAGAWGWWALGRPVALVDAPPGRIACVSYAPFHRAGETPLNPHAFVSPERIDADLRALSQRFDCVRTYSQGQGLSAVPRIAQRYGMQVLLGIWLGRDRAANAEQVRLGIATARAYPQVLRGVIVGNEVLLRGELSEAALAAYVRQVRDAVTTPVTYADVWEFWLRHRALANAVDYITVHILPYWEDQPVAPQRALQHVATVYAKVRAAFPGREVMIGETGWPSAGRQRRAAVASRVNEARYLRGFLHYAASVHLPYNVIEAFDQPWKRAQEGTVGGYWGIFDAHSQPKFPLTGPVVEVPQWWLGLLAGLAGSGLFVLMALPARRWRGVRGGLALLLAGFAVGTALAWQLRQMDYAARDAWEWGISLAACALALATAVTLVRHLAAHLAQRVDGDGGALPTWLRAAWLFGLVYYDLLLVFDGRYRDFPLGLFALPCVAFALLDGVLLRTNRPSAEQRLLALAAVGLGSVIVVQEAGLTASAWLWFALNLALAWPVLRGWLGAWAVETVRATKPPA